MKFQLDSVRPINSCAFKWLKKRGRHGLNLGREASIPNSDIIVFEFWCSTQKNLQYDVNTRCRKTIVPWQGSNWLRRRNRGRHPAVDIEQDGKSAAEMFIQMLGQQLCALSSSAMDLLHGKNG